MVRHVNSAIPGYMSQHLDLFAGLSELLCATVRSYGPLPYQGLVALANRMQHARTDGWVAPVTYLKDAVTFACTPTLHREAYLVRGDDKLYRLPDDLEAVSRFPVPEGDDYVSGFYNLYARYVALKGNRGVGELPDEVLDELFGRL